MPDDVPFERGFDGEPGEAVTLSPLVRRVLAPNPSPFTFKGTCTYIVGRGEVAIIDPGPDDTRHIDAVLKAVASDTVTHIVVTHTHRDHTAGLPAMKQKTGAVVAGCGPHRAARPLALGEANPLDASGDKDYAPDVLMREGDEVGGSGWRLAAVETPGHTANHLCFALPEESALFSGDHVMAWSTSIVAPPDGSMSHYMASLEKLRAREEAIYWPGHGGPVKEPRRFVRALLHHRRQREAAILGRLGAGEETIAAIVPKIYDGLAPALFSAAGLSVFAHLEDLVARGLATTDGAPALDGRYRLA